jgi:very-short-patch-repair endonuclease
MLARCGGVATRSLLFRQGLARVTLDGEVRSGALVTVAPETYCRPWDADQIEIRERGALMSTGCGASLSHLSALRRWKLLDLAEQVHITVPAKRNPRGCDSIVTHRATRYPPVVRLNGLVTVDAATAVVTSWPLLAGPDQRGPAITAVRERLVTATDLGVTLERHQRLSGRQRLVDLAGLLADGCESELEIWGYREVFDHPGLRHAVRQKKISVAGVTYRLDHAYEDERVVVEMDGQAYHSTPEQRERDTRRDAALATRGWLTLRYSYRRLHNDVAGCRRDTLAVLANRRDRRR